jgi:hypothetical protein
VEIVMGAISIIGSNTLIDDVKAALVQALNAIGRHADITRVNPARNIFLQERLLPKGCHYCRTSTSPLYFV